MIVIDEPLDCVGDLKLSTRRWLDRSNRYVDARVEQIHTNKCEIRFWLFWLLNEFRYFTIGANFRNTEPLRIGNPGKQNLCRRNLRIASS